MSPAGPSTAAALRSGLRAPHRPLFSWVFTQQSQGLLQDEGEWAVPTEVPHLIQRPQDQLDGWAAAGVQRGSVSLTNVKSHTGVEPLSLPQGPCRDSQWQNLKAGRGGGKEAQPGHLLGVTEQPLYSPPGRLGLTNSAAVVRALP